MKKRTLYRLAFFGLITLILASVLTAATAANSVPVTRLIDWSTPINVVDNLLACRGMNPMPTITKVCQSHENVCNGSFADELIIGGPDTKEINGKGGIDCCIAAPGTDTTLKCDYHN